MITNRIFVVTTVLLTSALPVQGTTEPIQSNNQSTQSVYARATICEDCNVSQARELARQHAAPRLECRYANEVPDPATETCTSTPGEYIVYSAATQQTYGFVLQYTNQGSSSANMTLSFTDKPVPSELVRLLSTAAQAHRQLQQSLGQIPTELLLQPGVYPRGTHANRAALLPSASGCSNNPHVRAIRDALDGRQRLDTLQMAASNSMVRRNAETVSWFKNKDGLTRFVLDSVSFAIASPAGQLGTVTVEGTFKVSSGNNTQFITRTYYPTPAHDKVEVGLTATSASFSKVVDRIDYSSGLPVVSVDANGTFIEGVPLNSILNSRTNTPAVVSGCVHQALRVLTDVRASAGGGQEGPGGPVDGGGSNGTLPMCTYDVYTNGNWTGSYRSVC